MNLKKLKSKQAKESQYQRAGNDPFEKLGVWGHYDIQYKQTSHLQPPYF